MKSFTSEMLEAAAQHLVAARGARRPGERMPEACRPSDVDAALAIQRRVAEILGLPIAGWKCSVPNAERTVAAAPIFAPTIFSVSPCPIQPIAGKARIEPEIAFVIDRDLPPRAAAYTEADLRAAIRETRAVLELLGPRYADPAAVTFPELLADGIANQGLFVGPVVSDGLDRPLGSFHITIDEPDQTLLSRNGKHPDGDPMRPLLWLANYLATHGTGLGAGQVVTTGSYCGAIDVPLDTELTVTFGDLAKLSLRFARAK